MRGDDGETLNVVVLGTTVATAALVDGVDMAPPVVLDVVGVAAGIDRLLDRSVKVVDGDGAGVAVGDIDQRVRRVQRHVERPRGDVLAVGILQAGGSDYLIDDCPVLLDDDEITCSLAGDVDSSGCRVVGHARGA